MTTRSLNLVDFLMGLPYKLIAGILFAVFGVFSIFFGIRLLQTNSAQWPLASGTVSAARLIVSRSQDSTSYYVNVEYIYSIDDIPYMGSLNTPGRTTQAQAENEFGTYYPGAQVTFVYDPTDPRITAASQGAPEKRGYTAVAGGLFFLVVAGLFLLWHLRDRRPFR